MSKEKDPPQETGETIQEQVKRFFGSIRDEFKSEDTDLSSIDFWLWKLERRFKIQDNYIKELMKENEELKKEINHVKDVWIGISDGKDLIIKKLQKENKKKDLIIDAEINVVRRLKKENKELRDRFDSKYIFDLWRMAQRYNCDDFHKMVNEHLNNKP